jgi:uncharacterized protein YbbK (DUF523 family)
MIIVSACLLGVNCRWNGQNSLEKKLWAYLPDLLPVCPEQLGGLSTPRDPVQIIGGNGFDVLAGKAGVKNAFKKDVTKEFITGAQSVLRIAGLYNVKKAILKEGSPSCGVHQIYRDKSIIAGMGVTAAILRQEGLIVISEEDLE